ncbi:hypothetical protein [uncultured Thalassolituus sp.]|uniref:hypothetical protein n=1 Tax=uncultured Thalassolituus sp. TaxID=285273 RepID=UPI0026097208|nr:hypothetical protein [uncultured Thalassolituus sp.]
MDNLTTDVFWNTDLKDYSAGDIKLVRGRTDARVPAQGHINLESAKYKATLEPTIMSKLLYKAGLKTLSARFRKKA